MSQINNFNGKIHRLSHADRVKGGKVSSRKKSQANGLKNLRHGKYSGNHHYLLSCVDCPAVGRCDKMSDGYCYFLLEEMKLNRDFSKQVARCLTVGKDDIDALSFLTKKYRLNKEYISKLFPTE